MIAMKSDVPHSVSVWPVHVDECAAASVSSRRSQSHKSRTWPGRHDVVVALHLDQTHSCAHQHNAKR